MPQRTNYVLSPTVERFILTSRDLTAGAGSQTFSLMTLARGSVVRMVRTKHVVAFAGGGASSCTVEVGSAAGATDEFSSAFDIFQAASNTALQVSGTPAAATFAEDTLTATIKADVNVNVLTAGEVYIDVEIVALPNISGAGPAGNDLDGGWDSY